MRRILDVLERKPRSGGGVLVFGAVKPIILIENSFKLVRQHYFVVFECSLEVF